MPGVVGGRAVHPLRRGLQAAVEVPAADDDRQLGAVDAARRRPRGRSRAPSCGSTPVLAVAHQALARELEQDAPERRRDAPRRRRSAVSVGARRHAAVDGDAGERDGVAPASASAWPTVFDVVVDPRLVGEHAARERPRRSAWRACRRRSSHAPPRASTAPRRELSVDLRARPRPPPPARRRASPTRAPRTRCASRAGGQLRRAAVELDEHADLVRGRVRRSARVRRRPPPRSARRPRRRCSRRASPTSSSRSCSSASAASGPPACTASSTVFGERLELVVLRDRLGLAADADHARDRAVDAVSRRDPRSSRDPARLPADASPRSRSSVRAASRSPPVSCRARLQSIIPAPVWSRSSLTSLALISVTSLSALGLRPERPPARRCASRRAPARGRRFGSASAACRGLGSLCRLGRFRGLRGAASIPAAPPSLCPAAIPSAIARTIRRARADRVVVSGDHVVRLVGVAVRVDEGDHRQAQPLRFPHGELLRAQVDDEHGVGLPAHVGDAAEVRLELLELGLHRDPLLGGQQLELALRLQPAQLVEIRDAVGDRAPVRQQPAQPAVVDVRHADPRRLVADGVLGLLLRADEQDRAAALGDVAREVVGLLQQFLRLLEVDDVDPAALGEDEAAHLRVPAARLVAEVHSGLQQLLHGDDCHGDQPLSVSVVVLRPAGRTEPGQGLGTTARAVSPGRDRTPRS